MKKNFSLTAGKSLLCASRILQQRNYRSAFQITIRFPLSFANFVVICNLLFVAEFMRISFSCQAYSMHESESWRNICEHILVVLKNKTKVKQCCIIGKQSKFGYCPVKMICNRVQLADLKLLCTKRTNWYRSVSILNEKPVITASSVIHIAVKLNSYVRSWDCKSEDKRLNKARSKITGIFLTEHNRAR